jgi:hypothetical protein
MNAKAVPLRFVVVLEVALIRVPYRLPDTPGKMNICCGYQKLPVFLLDFHDPVKRVFRLLESLNMLQKM